MNNLSICVPTYNRSYFLENCLNSIKLESRNTDMSFEVCISDNYSSENIIPIIDKYKKYYKIIYHKNRENIGVARNILKVVSLSSNNFIWLLGNDDFILPGALNYLKKLFMRYSDVDFYYINSFNMYEHTLQKYSHPIVPSDIDISELSRFSNYKKSEYLNFFDLIDYKKSFDYLLSMNLCVFKRILWNENLNTISIKNLEKKGLFSTFENTAPHVKIWASAFNKKKAFFVSNPLSINVHGPRARDWGDMYDFVIAVRIPQLLDLYRQNGLPFFRYIISKNYALRRLLPSLFNMILKPSSKGFYYTNVWSDVIKNLLYPSIYVFGFYFFLKKVLKFLYKK